jgi:hypothetical protein
VLASNTTGWENYVEYNQQSTHGVKMNIEKCGKAQVPELDENDKAMLESGIPYLKVLGAWTAACATGPTQVNKELLSTALRKVYIADDARILKPPLSGKLAETLDCTNIAIADGALQDNSNFARALDVAALVINHGYRI